MYKIIDKRGTGKTSRLMLLAKENNAIIACVNPLAMKQKAHAYGITGIDFISYSDIEAYRHSDRDIYIDELETFAKSFTYGRLKGYTLTSED